MRKRFIDGEFKSHQIAKELKISTITSWRYLKEFERIKAAFPKQLPDMEFYIPEPPKLHRDTPLYTELFQVLPQLFKNTTDTINITAIWLRYKKRYPDGYTYSPFKKIARAWLSEIKLPTKRALLTDIPQEDLKRLKNWRHANNHRNWQIAVTLMMAYEGASVMEIMDKVESSRRTVNRWLHTYQTKGLKGFSLPVHQRNKAVIKLISHRKDQLTKLIHETPKTYQLNRTSWTITALTSVYNQIHADQVTYPQVRYCLKQMRYTYKKSRDMLTSQDPQFRKKIAAIQRILQRLKPNEKFFSIDEYGPVSIKIKGGRTLKHKDESPDIIPEKQQCKGIVICTAALELSTNQVTHFYSLKKNTFEMIKLIDLLLSQYQDQERLYLCWDAVSWHNSQILKNYIDDRNQKHKPAIKLAPLPSCTQFLNVIESVFGGLAKAVIHNSDYATVADCKAAIDLHFQNRNNHFKANPKRAGRKIWGKEIVIPKFSELHHTKRSSAMRGARSL